MVATFGFHPESGMRLLGIAPHPAVAEAMGIVAEAQVADDATVVDTLCADLSNWDWDTFSPACFVLHGIKQAIVGWQRPDIAGAMCKGLHSQEITVSLSYQFVYFDSGTGPQQAIAAAVQGALDNGIPRVTIDCETDSASAPPSGATQRNAQLLDCVKMVLDAKLEPWIYSAPWWWVPQHGDTHQFAEMGCKLWLANYGANDGNLPPIRRVAFGGWETCQIHQYWSLGNYCGRKERDINYVWSDAFGAGTPAQEDQMGEEAMDRLAAVEQGLKDLEWAVFSGNEDRANSDAQRAADVAYRIAQRLGRASDGTVMNSVADNAFAAINAVQKLATASGLNADQVRDIVGSELADMLDAAKGALKDG